MNQVMEQVVQLAVVLLGTSDRWADGQLGRPWARNVSRTE
jgi:hypothetical protein